MMMVNLNDVFVKQSILFLLKLKLTFYVTDGMVDRPFEMSLTYVQEQNEIKKSFRPFIEDEKVPSDKNIGGLFIKKKKSKEEEVCQETFFKIIIIFNIQSIIRFFTNKTGRRREKL